MPVDGASARVFGPPLQRPGPYYRTGQARSDLLAIVKRAADSNILLAEDFLARNAVGDQGAPEAGAPAAAGGAL